MPEHENAPAVAVEVVGLPQVVVGLDRRWNARTVRSRLFEIFGCADRPEIGWPGHESVRAGDLEAAQGRGPRDPVPEVDDVVDNCRVRGGFGVGDVRIRSRQDDVADRFESDPVVPGIEIDQGLGRELGTVGSGIDPNSPFAGAAGGRVERRLNVLSRIDIDEVSGLKHPRCAECESGDTGQCA